MKVSVHSKNGSALAVVIIIFAVLAVLGTAVLAVSVSENKFVNRQEDKMQAYYIARSGAHSVAEYLLRNPSADTDDIIGADSEINSQLKGGEGSFQVSVVDDIANRVVRIESVGTYKGIQQTARIIVTKRGSIFDHVIVAKNGVSVDNTAGSDISITGSVATKEGTIDLGNFDSLKDPEDQVEKIIDASLYFPPIVPPNTFSQTYNIINNNVTISTGGTSTSPGSVVSIKANSISLKNKSFNVTGYGIVHLYVYGNIDMQTNSSFNVASGAKLYIYVIENKTNVPTTVKLIGNGAQNNIFLYAPDSEVIWNNSQPNNGFFGSIIGYTVVLMNKLTIVHNPGMVDGIAVDITSSGIKYSGYNWID